MKKYYLAKDFGASSGRGIVGSIDKGKLSYEEIHRFPNHPVSVRSTLYWDVLSLYRELENVLLKAKDYAVVSLSVDTWGVDFGLLDPKGALLQILCTIETIGPKAQWSECSLRFLLVIFTDEQELNVWHSIPYISSMWQ